MYSIHRTSNFSRGTYISGLNVLGQPMTIKNYYSFDRPLLYINIFCIISLISILKQGKEDFEKEKKPIEDI